MRPSSSRSSGSSRPLKPLKHISCSNFVSGVARRNNLKKKDKVYKQGTFNYPNSTKMLHNAYGSLLCTALLFQDMVSASPRPRPNLVNTAASLGTATGIGSSRSILPQPLKSLNSTQIFEVSERLNKAMAGFGTDEKVLLLHSSSDHY
jgi:hypothetical protein